MDKFDTAQKQLIKRYPINSEGERVDFVSKTLDKEKFPYTARYVHAMVGATGDFTHWFSDQVKKFEPTEGQDFVASHEVSKNKMGPRTIKEYHLTRRLALRIAQSSRTQKGQEFAEYILDRMEANEATLKKIQEIGINNYLKQQDRVNSRNGFTNAIKSNEPNAGPSEYIRYTYAVKSYLGIACNRKKADLSDEELEKVMVAEATATMLSRRNNDMMANVKQSTDIVNDLAGRSTQDLFYDKDYSKKPTIKAKIHELITIITSPVKPRPSGRGYKGLKNYDFKMYFNINEYNWF